ncbi:MAG TPA: nickel pincer cofactor biosynthesis protein LarB [Thermomicrobiales bacterium]|nr:nickel pincer cofactor biosynthesis protein LarB [Thermomicrobiales bacterium]
MADPLDDLRAALAGADEWRPGALAVGDYARVDVGRAARKGVPEVVYAAGKTPAQVVAIVREILAHADRAVASRLTEEQHGALGEAAADADWAIARRAGCPTAVVSRPDAAAPPARGHVGVISAGTSDIPAADEARAMAEAMGCRVSAVYDVGVAGLHRLFGPLGRLFAEGVGALIVAAGMDGALPSVVAGLSPVPVIGLPTSIGYGAGGQGVAALLSMLQSCAPGLAVVNIDNGIGAGAMAALIARAAVGQSGSRAVGQWDEAAETADGRRQTAEGGRESGVAGGE